METPAQFVIAGACLKFYRYEKNCTSQLRLIKLDAKLVHLKIVRYVVNHLPY